MTDIAVPVRGPFSLAASSQFVERFPAGQGGGDDSRLDMAFTVDGNWRPVGVRVTQTSQDVVATVQHNPARVPRRRISDEVARILSLDVDGRDFAKVGRRDRVVGELQRRFPGLRPVLFYTPYEAAAWTIIGHRIRMTQAASVKARLADELGTSMDFGDHRLSAFPAPDVLSRLSPARGLTAQKVEQLQALGRAATEGWLTADQLRGMSHDEALTALQRLPGVGPFSAELILVRGAGEPDAFPRHETRLHAAMTQAYRLSNPTVAELEEIAERWRPFRSWVALLFRSSGIGAA